MDAGLAPWPNYFLCDRWVVEDPAWQPDPAAHFNRDGRMKPIVMARAYADEDPLGSDVRAWVSERANERNPDKPYHRGVAATYPQVYQIIKQGLDPCVFESIHGDRPCKFYVDVDVGEYTLDELRERLIRDLECVLGWTPREYMVLEACSATKTSYHFVFQDVVFASPTHLASWVKTHLEGKLEGWNRPGGRDVVIFDCNVYGTSRVFRCVGATKPGKDRFFRVLGHVNPTDFTYDEFLRSLVMTVDRDVTVKCPKNAGKRKREPAPRSVAASGRDVAGYRLFIWPMVFKRFSADEKPCPVKADKHLSNGVNHWVNLQSGIAYFKCLDRECNGSGPKRRCDDEDLLELLRATFTRA